MKELHLRRKKLLQTNKKILVSVVMILIFSIISTITTKGSELKDSLSISLNNNTLTESLDILAVHTGYSFAFSNNFIPKDIRFTKEFHNQNLRDILLYLFRGTGIKFKIVEEQIILTKKTKLQRYTISGFIRDNETGEALFQANVFDKESFQGSVSNEHGYYSLSLPEGIYTVVFSYIGRNPIEKLIALDKNITISIELNPNMELDEVIVFGTENKQIIKRTDPLGKINISNENFESMPVIMGEPDLMKSIQLIPGIQGGSEGNGAIYVRGGGALQNLFLIDDVPIYNCFHLLGLFSVFNSDIIGNTQVLKAGFPSGYGGRLSSVVDVTTKDGNLKEIKGKVSLGLISSKLFLEGPIIKDKTSFAVSGRLGYYYIYGELLPNEIGNDNNISNYNFNDINAKITHNLSDNHKLQVSFYMGNDTGEDINENEQKPNQFSNNYTFNKNIDGQNWKNTLGSIGWAGKINNKLFGDIKFAASEYRYSSYITDSSYIRSPTDTSFEFIGAELNNSVSNYFGSANLQYEISPSVKLKTGYKYSLLNLDSKNIRETNSKQDIGSNYNPQQDTTLAEYNYETSEHSGYLEINISPWRQFTINSGFHISYYTNNDYSNLSIQPRVTSNWEFTDDIILKASYSRMGQNIHLLGATRIKQASDLLVAAGDKAPSEESDQYSLGLSYLRFKNINVHIDAYYKQLNNLVNFSPGESYFSNASSWEDKIEIGTGEAKGIELLIEKTSGKLSGWIGYTYSYTTRTFENINEGQSFPFIYDHRHYLNIVGKYKFNEKFDLGFNWLFHTGSTATIPGAIYYTYSTDIYGRMAPNLPDSKAFYNEKNAYRLPSYHRLDLSVNYNRKNKWGRGKWSISIYNVYNRKNVYTSTYAEGWADILGPLSYSTRYIDDKKLFGIIPSASYTLSF